MTANVPGASSAPISGGAVEQPAAAAAGAAPGTFSASTTIGSMNELQAKAPDLYKAMMQGIAQNICGDMKDHQDRLKEIMREAERDAAGQS